MIILIKNNYLANLNDYPGGIPGRTDGILGNTGGPLSIIGGIPKNPNLDTQVYCTQKGHLIYCSCNTVIEISIFFNKFKDDCHKW